jgi:hypothetical protein
MSDEAAAKDNTAGLAQNPQAVGENLAPLSLGGEPAQTASTDAPEQQEATPATTDDTLSPSVAPAADEGSLAPGQEAPAAAETSTSSSDAEDTADGAPEQYEDFDLDKALFDDTAQEEFKGLAKELNLSQTDAAKAAKFGEALMKKLAEENQQEALKAQAEHDKAVKESVAKWQQDPAFKDKEMLAAKAAKHLGILDHIRQSGLNNDLVLLGALSEVGKLVSEAKALTAGSTSRGGEENPYVNSPELVN